MTDAIVKTVTVPLDPARAFALFTGEIADWWPLHTHSLSAREGRPAISVTVTPEPGGAVYETKPDGRTAPWGRVTDWKPGRTFGMTWHVGRLESEASHVRVMFDAVADGTRLTLVHDNWQALGDAAATLRENYRAGWDGVLHTCYARACRTHCQTA